MSLYIMYLDSIHFSVLLHLSFIPVPPLPPKKTPQILREKN